MNELQGSVTIPSLPYQGLHRITDILYFDGPILTHYKDVDGCDYLYHWVDDDSEYNRWLVYPVSEDALLAYVQGDDDIASLIDENTLIVVLDIDTSGKHSNMQLLKARYLPEEYLPIPDIYYHLPPPSYYVNLIENRIQAAAKKQEEAEHDAVLGELAFYLNIKNKKKSNGTHPAISHVTATLNEVEKSYNNYYPAVFSKEFGTDTSYQKSQLIAVNAGRGSFGIALASEFLSSAGNSIDGVYAFNKEVGQKFKEDVLEADFTTEAGLRDIESKFNAEEMKGIFQPIIKIANSKHVSLSLADRNFLPTRPLKKISPEASIRLVGAKAERTTEIEDEKEVITMVIEKGKNEDINSLSGKSLMQRSLYTKQDAELNFELNTLTWKQYSFKLVSPIVISVNFENQRYHAKYEPVDLDLFNSNYQALKDQTQETLVQLYNRLRTIDLRPLTDNESGFLAHLKSIIIEE